MIDVGILFFQNHKKNHIIASKSKLVTCVDGENYLIHKNLTMGFYYKIIGKIRSICQMNIYNIKLLVNINNKCR